MSVFSRNTTAEMVPGNDIKWNMKKLLLHIHIKICDFMILSSFWYEGNQMAPSASS